MKAKQDKSLTHSFALIGELSTTEDHLRDVVDAYVARFAVNGRLYGPIDEEVERAREYLQRKDKNTQKLLSLGRAA